MQEIRQPVPPEQSIPVHERCTCPLPTSLYAPRSPGSAWTRDFVPATQQLCQTLHLALASMLNSTTSCSVLLLHVVQCEHISLPPTAALVSQRLYCHASATFLAQILQQVRRTLRTNDQILVGENGTGAAMLFPDVDQEGVARILQRVAQSIKLLRAETVVPPLRYETEIVFGQGSYPRPAASLEELLHQLGQIKERITFRPAVVPLPGCQPEPPAGSAQSEIKEPPVPEANVRGVPIMQIPSRLPARLKRLIPHALALELRCAPVGRDHNRLIVAMANPTDTRALHHLREVTGMRISPVSCEIAALETLLASGW
ncbi:MAG TPA: hypothetical protein VFV38_08225 [Ktedonobacteraceae bacterium]|nr:hypothetical protein [Ktedonobacteraceae bacterium]